ncbi:deoxyribodipyrimidine photo-lyase [Hymenobacter sp. NBH84]|uniref:cryptochrome/photolyase family protein n=1 Tax=Hymenobacter sp. NBH84 TaxID=2596915 RepID=UPI0016288801|nr:deoxyribodipyrimidine photo-lyase [Hymenobacter sp. NBH84]QNE38802.1 deoxyribodipyrimidine photo-lyase [Hymenobacter sp. NBH84]
MKITIFWHRRDLRITDNTGLAAALQDNAPVIPLFIFDRDILDKLLSKQDARVTFIYDAVEQLAQETQDNGGTMLVFYGKPEEVFEQLLKDYDLAAVHTNEDYEPYARQRDEAIGKLLDKHDVPFTTHKDQVIFAKDEVLTKAGTPPKVYGPYNKAWRAALQDDSFQERPSRRLFTKENLHHIAHAPARPTLSDMGFERYEQPVPPARLPNKNYVEDYDKTRNRLADDHGTTHRSVHLRHGTLSVRQLMSQAQDLNDKLLDELIWRDYFMMLLWHFPNTVEESYDKPFRHIKWRNNQEEFAAWCEGRTGFPLVDAGMRQLNETGWMHNRARITTASFLIKDLLIDWKWGEQYFADKLIDYDMSNNIGNWQWTAGTGVVSAPWFRIFSPESQLQKYDPKLEYVKDWIPEFGTDAYPQPIVDHKEARQRALDAYRAARK